MHMIGISLPTGGRKSAKRYTFPPKKVCHFSISASPGHSWGATIGGGSGRSSGSGRGGSGGGGDGSFPARGRTRPHSERGEHGAAELGRTASGASTARPN